MRRRPSTADAIVLPGVGEALRTTKALVARSVVSLSESDLGFFGPGSVSWRIFSHASYGASGIAAALAQAMHRTAMHAVHEHSAFRNDAWRRAHMTADYVFTITFGSRETADAAARRVRHIHRGVAGTEPATGRAYRADDPDLLLWIHCAHTEYALRGYERYAALLSAADADRFVREQVVAAGLVGLDPARVPADRAALLASMAAAEDLVLTDPARQFARTIVEARMPLTMRPFWALHLAAAVALLPDELARAYGFPRWLPRGKVAVWAIGLGLRAVNLGFLLFRPVRQARARLRWAERVGARRA